MEPEGHPLEPKVRDAQDTECQQALNVVPDHRTLTTLHHLSVGP
jgi:hypothetical protein